MENQVYQFLTEQGFQCDPYEFCGKATVIVSLRISDHVVKLLLVMEDRFLSLPKFLLLEPSKFGKLAHVNIASIEDTECGVVCVNAPESISVNFDQPLLLLKDSLERHTELLELVITDPAWNERELLREFYSNWLFLCDKEKKPLLINFSQPILQRVDVYEPLEKVPYGLHSYNVAHPSDSEISELSEMHFATKGLQRKLAGKAIVIPIDNLTPAPNSNEPIEEWYLNTINSLPDATLRQLCGKFGQWRDKHYWLVFTAITVDENRTWFAIRLDCEKRRTLPLSTGNLNKWRLTPISVRVFNQENVVQRGGGSTSLADKKVAVVGIGSVGSEIVHKLAAAGIRHLHLVDPDCYQIDNLYRHVLPQAYIDMPKAIGMVHQCHAQFPWSDARHSYKSLIEFSQKYPLDFYDLIVIAIGNPTHERFFKQYLLDNNINVTTLNCWLEGYGVGGHAVLDACGKEGCLLCAYVDLNDGSRGLQSNLNFIEANQDVMKSIAGCGSQFINYGAVSSAQTATMAASLAIRYLEGRQADSCKVSWKGDDNDVQSENIKLTHRYYHFKESLKRLPLFNEDCDVCNH
ncbi:ThiF family adenylyltransferase [Halomonas sp. MCCC 1A11062]|uniref:ThiF family adenylyltransferase n=1 Tax=Halomonas sp. MCCC 1A11062 TaxID=2733485 RepID=UPI001F3EA280|nr:ThiF family adenylyltransferase [Halomonas sp. MCCC 1A11062]MCE8039810.1 ThiF family adenylyltransferase [Halomonas sp. MCCC 1A11062]